MDSISASPSTFGQRVDTGDHDLSRRQAALDDDGTARTRGLDRRMPLQSSATTQTSGHHTIGSERARHVITRLFAFDLGAGHEQRRGATLAMRRQCYFHLIGPIDFGIGEIAEGRTRTATQAALEPYLRDTSFAWVI